MTYSGSQAIAGRGSSLSIGGTPTLIGEIRSCTPSGNAWGTEDVTNFQSGPDQEFITTIRNNGQFKVAGNRVSTDAGQVLVEAAYASGAINSFTLQLPKQGSQTTNGDKYVFNALVETRDFAVEYNKEISWTLSLKVSGAVAYTAGT